MERAKEGSMREDHGSKPALWAKLNYLLAKDYAG